MSIELLANCDKCGKGMNDGDEEYCRECYHDLENAIERLEIENKILQEKIEKQEVK